MTGFVNQDGSSLVGALKPDGTGLALQLDAQGNLKVVGVAGSALLGKVQIADSGGANLLSVDASGRLTLVPNQPVKVVDSGGSNQLSVDSSGRVKANIDQWAGAAPGLSNPVITEDQVRAWIANGQGFSASIGILNSAAGTNNYPLSVFNPNNSGKSILLYSIQVSNGSGGMTALLQLVTGNPAFADQITPINMKAGGPNSALPAAAITAATTNQTIAAPYKQVVTLASTTLELLTNGAAILLPSGSNNGLVAYIQTYGAGINSVLARWIEF